MPSLRHTPEYRKDPLSNSWVVISAERNGRPEEFREIATQRVEAPCPFCVGNEEETPEAIALYRHDSYGGTANSAQPWQVRVVPNKFPAVARMISPACQSSLKSFSTDPTQLFTTVCGHGGHEVIIESPTHAVSLTDLSPGTVELAFLAYRDRMRALKGEGDWAYVQVFKNVGAAAGSSIEHAHSQVIALPIIPVRVAEELEQTEAFWKRQGKRLFTALLEQELAAGVRIVCESPEFVAFCPFASRFPFETWILPKTHDSCFEDAQKAGSLGWPVRIAHFIESHCPCGRGRIPEVCPINSRREVSGVVHPLASSH